MKLDDAACFSTSGTSKRKCHFDSDDRRAKRPFVEAAIPIDVDVLQSRVNWGRVSSQALSRRGVHAARYPVNCDPIDGVSPNVYYMQVNKTTCSRCLQGEPGHFRHILEK